MEKSKCFVTGAFPYMNGLLHIGHARVYSLCDVIARYNKLLGKKTLFPMGYHITGTPILAIAEAIKNNDQKTIKIFKTVFKVPDEELKKFVDPVYVAKYFIKESEKTFKEAKLDIDFERSFFTSDEHPQFSRFVEWQFNKLKEKGYIIKGNHPVKWEPVYNMALGDHDIAEGEDTQILEFTLIKFRLDENDIIFPCATLRPETIYGVTNIWINPEGEYVLAKVEGEKWVLSKRAFEKLKFQKDNVELIEIVDPKNYINKYVINPLTKEKVPIFGAEFVDPNNATGVVMSVPTHAPFDYIALKDLGKLDEVNIKYLVDNCTKVEDIVKKLGITSQKDKEKLEQATKKIYREEFHKGVFNFGELKGVPVSKAKEIIKKKLLENNLADIFYELSGKTISKFGNEAVVKVVKDQWFIDYGNKEWKEKVKKHLKNMKIYPEEFRKHFEAVIDWIDRKACVRDKGLGTRFPFDKKYIIESLSDSTIYMAYYTISGIINREKIKAEQLTDELFDYIFLEDFNENKEIELEKNTGIKREIINEMKKEFEFWYPVDYRVSGKDLIPNHLTFFIFNHVAIFREKHWPRAIVAVGYVNLEGKKMSKSKGNTLNYIDAVERYGPDTIRFYLTSATDIKNDLSVTFKELEEVKEHLIKYKEQSEKYTKIDSLKINLNNINNLDRWILWRLNETIKKYNDFMEDLKFRNAVSEFFYLFYLNDLKWYIYRGGKEDILRLIYSRLNAMLKPFAPDTVEGLYYCLDPIDVEITEEVKLQEKYLKELIEDIKNAIKLSKLERPSKVYIYTCPDWMWKIVNKIKETKNINEIMKDKEINKYGKDALRIIKRLIKENITERIDEEKIILENKEFIEKETGLKVVLNPEEDPQNKRKVAIPTKPGILILE